MCSSIFISTAITRKNIKTISCKNPYIYTQRKPFKSRSFCTELLKRAKSSHDRSLGSFLLFFQPTNNNYLNFNEVLFLIAK